MELGKFIPALCMLLGLMKPSTAVDADCNYEQKVQPGRTYYVYNPGYPNYYEGQHSCVWRAKSNTRLKLSCNLFNVPASPNCSQDALTVQISNDIEYTYCGLNSFVVESLSREMIIKFHSNYNTIRGRFECELTATKEECSCGWKNPDRIVGGVETGVNEFPMMAGLVSLVDRLLFCGSTIITESHVLTAAHCVYEYANDIAALAVIVGEHNVKRGDETDATRIYRVASVELHPEYNQLTKYADVAIVKSSQKFTFSMKVGPVCLPFYYTWKNFTGSTVTALGWGLTDFGGKKSDTLRKVDLKVISQERCIMDYKNITSNNICTFARGKDACQFDSGGPMLWESPESDKIFIVGITSFGATCADERAGVNTRPSSFWNFILSKIAGYNYCKAL